MVMRLSGSLPGSIRHYARSLVAAVVLLSASLAPAGPGDTAHYSWLWHTSDVPPNSTSLGAFVPTFYRILDEATWPTAERTEELLTREGQLLARVTLDFRHQLDIEGSARLRDGRILNIEERVGGAMRYLLVRGAPFGVGAPGYRLGPYRTGAGDPPSMKRGAGVYLPAVVRDPPPAGGAPGR